MFKLFYWHNSTVLHQSNVHLHVYPPIYFNAGSYTIFFGLLNPMCQVYLALLYIVYVYLTLLSVYIFRIKLLMLCLYTYAYCIYDIDVVYFMGLYIYHQRPTLCHRVERHYHGSLYFIFPYMKSL